MTSTYHQPTRALLQPSHCCPCFVMAEPFENRDGRCGDFRLLVQPMPLRIGDGASPRWNGRDHESARINMPRAFSIWHVHHRRWYETVQDLFSVVTVGGAMSCWFSSASQPVTEPLRLSYRWISPCDLVFGNSGLITQIPVETRINMSSCTIWSSAQPDSRDSQNRTIAAAAVNPFV